MPSLEKIFLIWSFLNIYYWVRAAGTAGTESRTSGKVSSEPIIIVISFDGFRYNYLDRINASNLNSLGSAGVRAKFMKNQFITKTFPNHQSIATGLHVESHGVTDNWLFDPDFNRTLGERDHELWKFNDDILPIWTLNELAGGNHRSGVMMWPGSNYGYGPNNTVPSHFFHWNESVSWTWRVDTVIDWLTDKTKPANLVFMYFEEPDEFAHGFGPESPETTAQIQKVEDTVGYLVGKLKEKRLFDAANLIILSDHGFQEVRQDQIINISSVVDTDFYYRYGSTPVLHLIPKPDKFTVVYQRLQDEAKSNGHFKVYSKEELPARWHYQHNRRIGQIVLVADLGYAFDDFYQTIGEYNHKYNLTANASRVYGVHGYDNDEMQMRPFFLAHGPLFKSGVTVEPFENIDLFPLLCLLLGIHAPPNNGTIGHMNVLRLGPKMGFGFHSPVAWVVGAAVLVGLTISFGILSMMIVRRKGQTTVVVVENGYRFVNERESMDHDSVVPSRIQTGAVMDNKAVKSDSKRSNIFENGDTDEIQALLLSSSNEEL